MIFLSENTAVIISHLSFPSIAIELRMEIPTENNNQFNWDV